MEKDPKDGHLTIRIPPGWVRQLQDHAKKNERTISGEVRVAIRDHLKRVRA
jgi:predicted transcriptional regulator